MVLSVNITKTKLGWRLDSEFGEVIGVVVVLKAIYIIIAPGVDILFLLSPNITLLLHSKIQWSTMVPIYEWFFEFSHYLLLFLVLYFLSFSFFLLF